MILRVHNYVKSSSVNGPGKRFCLWVQGCNLNCPNCFNPQTHSLTSGTLYETIDISQLIISTSNIEGVSISGGEPFLQSEALLELVKVIKRESNLSILIFSGFAYDELKERRIAQAVLEKIDILVAGRYDDNLKIDDPILSSSNQKVHFLTNRYSLSDFATSNREIIITKEGNIVLSGVGQLP